MSGLLGNMFDLNRDGEVDSFEHAMELHFLETVENEDEEEDDECLTELEMAGINPNHLGYMGEDERREVLEAAGLDPDEYDF